MRKICAGFPAIVAGALLLAVQCDRTPEPEPITTKWIITLNSSWDWGASPALGPDGTVYVICVPPGNDADSSFLCAVNSNGTVKWQTNVGQPSGPCYVTPSVAADGTVYVVSSLNDSAGLTAVTPDGAVKWRHAGCTGQTICPAIAADGTIYVINRNGFLLALSPAGDSQWSYDARVQEATAAVIGVDGTVYVGGDQWTTTYALSPSGNLKWKCGWADFPGGSPPVIGPGGNLYALDLANNAIVVIDTAGDLKNVFRYQEPPVQPPVFGADQRMYFTDRDARLYATDSAGVLRWSRHGGNGSGPYNQTGLAATADSLIYYSDNEYDDDRDFFRGVDTDGNERRFNRSWSWAVSHPVVAPDGTIYLLTEDRLLLAFEGSAPPADSPWPMFMHDAQHTGRAVAK